jgi:hypothetical protein
MNIAKQRAVRKNIVVALGHGEPNGWPFWAATSLISNEAIGTSIASSDAPSLLVAGNCYGGAVAKYVSCGFFGASPDRVASGCWETEDSRVRDYANGFFKALAEKSRDPSQTLNDVHFTAALAGAESDVPYTVVDSAVDQFFLENASALPDAIAPATIRALPLTTGERAALRIYAPRLEEQASIDLQSKTVQVFISVGKLRADGKREWVRGQSAIRLDRKAANYPVRLASPQDEKRIVSQFPNFRYYQEKGQLTAAELVLAASEGKTDPQLCVVEHTTIGPPGTDTLALDCRSDGFAIERNRASNPMPLQILRRGVARAAIQRASGSTPAIERFRNAEACESEKAADFLK